MESLSQRLFELRTLLDKLQQTSPLPPFEKPTIQDEAKILDESCQQILLLQEILQNSPVGIAVVSGDALTFRLANTTYRHLLPDAQVDIIGLPYETVWSSKMGFEGDGLIRKMLDSGKNLHFDRLEQRYPDGLTRNISQRICRLAWHGEPGALILIQETTQADRARQLAMEIAEEAHNRAAELDAIIMAMAEAVTIFNARGMATRANSASLELYGMDPVGLDRSEMIELLAMRNPDGSPMQVEELPSERALRGETILGQRLLLVDNEGRERMVLASASPLFDEVGVTAVVSVWHDVTERERLLEQLEIEQSRLETIIKNAPEGILVADEEGRLVMGNPAAERILGQAIPYGHDLAGNAALNLCYSDGSPYDPRNLPLTCSALDGEQYSNVEMMVVLVDGQVRNILASTAPIVDRKGNLNGAVGILQDITQRKWAEEELRRQAGRSQLLASLSREFAEAGLHYHELLNIIVREVGQVFGDLCSLHLFEDDGKRYYPAAVFTDNREQLAALQALIHDLHVQADDGLTGQVFRTGQPVIVPDLPAEQIETLLPVASFLFSGQVPPKFINALIVPLRAHGRWIGALSILRLQRGNRFSGEDQVFLQDLADRAALAIEGTWLYEREALRARELQALHQATTALLSTIDLETLLAQILDAAQQAIPTAEQGVLFLLSAEDNHLEVRAAFGRHDAQSINPELQHQAFRAVQEKRPLILNALNAIASTHPDDTGAGSAIIAPLTMGENVLGALALFGAHAQLFTENDLSLLNNFAATSTAALQNATLYAEVQRLATTDTLTELYNRRKFFELGELEIHRSRRFHTPLSAIMLDLDTFKDINDTFGHGVGDEVLHIVAQRCRVSIRVVDILGRYGGDEFAILLPDADLFEAREIAERIRQAVIQSPVPTSRGDVFISISLGVTQAHHEKESLTILLGRADAALYVAKQGGRNRVMHD